MGVLRVALLAGGLIAGFGKSMAQTPVGITPLLDFVYWEHQPQSYQRDSLLLRLYASKAQATPDPDSAMVWLQKGFKIALLSRSNTGLAFVHNRMGLAYFRNGVSFQAIEYLFKGLQYAEIAKNPIEQAYSWDYIGDCYATLKNYEQAIIAENKAIVLYQSSGNTLGQAASLNDLGAVLSAHQQLPAAISALEKSLALNQDLNNPDLRVGTYLTLAATLLKKEDFDQADHYANLALAIQGQTKGRASAELLAFMSLVEARRNQPDQSLRYAARAEIYMSSEWPSTQEQVAFTLSKPTNHFKNPMLLCYGTKNM